MVWRLLVCLFCLVGGFALPAAALDGVEMDAVFPYSLTAERGNEVPAGSTQLFYLAIEHANRPEEAVHVEVAFPEGFSAAPDGWTVSGDGRTVSQDMDLPADYGQIFKSFAVSAGGDVPPGNASVHVTLAGDGWTETKDISFSVSAPGTGPAADTSATRKTLSWYIQGITVPVDSTGKKDDRQARNTMYIRDVTLENIRSRLTGQGGVDWGAMRGEPVTYVLVELRNPRRDIRNLHFRAQLVDRKTGIPAAGLVTAGGQGAGWTDPTDGKGTEAAIGLTGDTVQNVVLPLYGDPYVMEEGEYNLRTTIWDENSSKTTETPMTVVKKRNIGLVSVSFALLCVLGVIASLGKLRKCILSIGARGDIAVALFAALAFGGVVVPVTLLGDFFHVILGPFAGLVTGLLSGVLQYMLLMALLVLFRKPGTLALFFLIKWLLAGMLFGRFTPVAILNYAVYIGILEFALYATGFYRKKELTLPYAACVCLAMGVSDMAITFLNLQQLMFFYRLYYADWFIGLYMVVNGLLYSSIGSWLGIRIGKRLQQVMGQ